MIAKNHSAWEPTPRGLPALALHRTLGATLPFRTVLKQYRTISPDPVGHLLAQRRTLDALPGRPAYHASTFEVLSGGNSNHRTGRAGRLATGRGRTAALRAQWDNLALRWQNRPC